MSTAMLEKIKKNIREVGFKVQTRTSKFASEHEEEIEKVRREFSETKNKIEETKLGKKVKENTDKFSLDHEKELTTYKKRLSDAKLKLKFTVINALAEKRDDEKIEDENSESEETLISMGSNGIEQSKINKTSDIKEGEEKNDVHVVIWDNSSFEKTIIESDKNSNTNAIYPEIVKKLGFQLHQNKSLSSNYKEEGMVENIDLKPNYLTTSTGEDSEKEKESKENISETLKAKLISAKANPSAFLEKNKKENNKKEGTSDGLSNNCDIDQTQDNKNAFITEDVNFVATDNDETTYFECIEESDISE